MRDDTNRSLGPTGISLDSANGSCHPVNPPSLASEQKQEMPSLASPPPLSLPAEKAASAIGRPYGACDERFSHAGAQAGRMPTPPPGSGAMQEGEDARLAPRLERMSHGAEIRAALPTGQGPEQGDPEEMDVRQFWAYVLRRLLDARIIGQDDRSETGEEHLQEDEAPLADQPHPEGDRDHEPDRALDDEAPSLDDEPPPPPPEDLGSFDDEVPWEAVEPPPPPPEDLRSLDDEGDEVDGIEGEFWPLDHEEDFESRPGSADEDEAWPSGGGGAVAKARPSSASLAMPASAVGRQPERGEAGKGVGRLTRKVRILDPEAVAAVIKHRPAPSGRDQANGRDALMSKMAEELSTAKSEAFLREIMPARQDWKHELEQLAETASEAHRRVLEIISTSVGVLERAGWAVNPDAELEPVWPPLLLVGPPGTGKTTFVSCVAEALGWHVRRIAMEHAHESGFLAGSSRVYGNSQPGMILSDLVLGKEANRIYFFDEIDKAGSGVWNDDPLGPLTSLLEPRTARRFTDFSMPEIEIDARWILIVAAANKLDEVPPHLRDRFLVCRIRPYGDGGAHPVLTIAARITEDVGRQLGTRMILRTEPDSLTGGWLRRKLRVNREFGCSLRDLRKLLLMAGKRALNDAQHPRKAPIEIRRSDLEWAYGVIVDRSW
ncbi:MAG: hypothetical protein KatS3mg125_0481 [Lysobacterales bacterium]|nr:MAG: hypothetical protein KatS3mg125_0481 [Xanthomonadales bacterium]